MAALLITRNLLLFLLLVPLIGSHAQGDPDPEASADHRKKEIIHFCQGLVGATNEDVWAWQMGEQPTWTRTCFAACISRRLPFEEPPEDHYSHKLAKDNGCRTY